MATVAYRWLLAGSLALVAVGCGVSNHPDRRAAGVDGEQAADRDGPILECLAWSVGNLPVTVVMEVEFQREMIRQGNGGNAAKVRVVRVIQRDDRTWVSPDAQARPAAPHEDTTVVVHNWSPLAEARDAVPGTRWVIGAAPTSDADVWGLSLAFAPDGAVPNDGPCPSPVGTERLREATGTDTDLEAVVALLHARHTDAPDLAVLEAAVTPLWEADRGAYLADRESYQVGLPIEPEEVDEFVRARGLDEAPTHRWEVILWYGDTPPASDLAVHFDGIGLLGGAWVPGPMPFVMPGAHGPALDTFDVVTWDDGLVYGVDPPRVLGTYTVDDLDAALAAMATRGSLFVDLTTGEVRLMTAEEASELFMEHALG